MTLAAKELRNSIEAILLASGDPVTIEQLTEVFPDEGAEAIRATLDEITAFIDDNLGGFRLELAAGGYRFATRPEHDSTLRKFFSRQNEGRLSMAALETLAIVAYRQPITAPEISDIRGVNSSGVLRTLLERRMLRIAGRKNVVGSPFLYRTTREFLTHFGLNTVQDLPRLEEFADILGDQLGEELLSGPVPDEDTDGEESNENAPAVITTEPAEVPGDGEHEVMPAMTGEDAEGEQPPAPEAGTASEDE